MKPIVSCLVIFLSLSVVLIYGESRQWGRRVAGDRQLDYAVLVNNSLPVPQKSSIYRYLPAPVGANKAFAPSFGKVFKFIS